MGRSMVSSSGIKLLIDTNVWLDLYIPGRTGSTASKDLLAECIGQGVTLLFPLRAINDVFWQVVQNNKRWVRESKDSVSESYAHAINAAAWDCVQNMQELATAVGADHADIWLATKLRALTPDFEDNMVLAAAERAEVDYLVTSDFRLIQKANVAAKTPEDMLALLRISV